MLSIEKTTDYRPASRKSSSGSMHGTEVASADLHQNINCEISAPSSKVNTPLLWQSMTWQEILLYRESGSDMALLPVGATEQHGPHLATSVDSVTAEKVAHAVSANTGVLVLPTVPYGCSLGHSHRWPGTLSLQPQTLIQVVVEIGEWAYASAIRKLVILNGHVTNFAPLRCALEILRSRFDDLSVALRNVAEISPRVRAAFFSDAEDWHANEAETSLMLALNPQLTRPHLQSEATDLDRTGGLFFSYPVNRTSLNGVTGNPAKATAARGMELFSWMVEDLAGQLQTAMLERPPLDHGYFQTT